MNGHSYFPVEIPHGIIKDGFFYTVLSPIDEKADIPKITVSRLSPSSGLEVVLARSSSTNEFQSFNFARAANRLKEFRETAIQWIHSNYTLSGSGADVARFAHELFTIQKMFIEDSGKRDLTPEQAVALKEMVDSGFYGCTTEDTTTIDPRIHILHPFTRSGAIKLVDLKGEDVQRIILDTGTFTGDDSLKEFEAKTIGDHLQPLVEHAHKYLDSLNNGKQVKYPTTESDLINALMRIYLKRKKGLFYHSWDEKRPFRIMQKVDPEKFLKKNKKVNIC
jgi:hypothetical protein